MFNYFKMKLSNHIKENVLTVLESKDINEENLLINYIKEWKDFTILVHFMRKIFHHLDI